MSAAPALAAPALRADAPTLNTRALRAEDRRAFVRVMSAAFAQDPLFLDLFGEDRRQPMAAHWRAVFFAYLFDRSRIAGHCLLGIFDAHGSLLAACVLEDSARRGPVLRLAWRALRLLPRLPWRSMRLLTAYMRRTRHAAPTSHHHYLTMVGTLPERQGQGIGTRLIHGLIDAARLSGNMQAIALDTENAGNVPRYEKLGFRVSQQLRVGETNVYCMLLTL